MRQQARKQFPISKMSPAILACFMIALLLIAGCAKPVNETAESLHTTRVPLTSSTPAADDLTCDPSGPLRIWWPERQSLHPLREMSDAGMAVYDLVYEGLFRIEADDRLTPVLAENMITLEKGLQVLIAIKPNLYFHDGTPVKAEDVAAVLSYLIQPGLTSRWSDQLRHVEQINVLDERALEIRLKEADEWFAWALTFPIVPADKIETEPFVFVPGTGPFTIENYDPQQGLKLKINGETGNTVRHIMVREYKDQWSAMRALEEDELDLVLLDSRAYPDYSLRSGLRTEPFAGKEWIIILSNTMDSPLDDPNSLASVKKTVYMTFHQTDQDAYWAEMTWTGLTAESWLAQASVTPVEDILNDLIRKDPEEIEMASLDIVVPESDPRRVALSERLAEALDAGGMPSTVHEQDTAVFWTSLVDRSYDLAIVSVFLPEVPIPGLLIDDSVPDAFALLLSFRSGMPGCENESYWTETWKQESPSDTLTRGTVDVVDPQWAEALQQAITRSPWISVCRPYGGLVYGSRVTGSCRPNRYHPYKDIEELWIWSGSLSSSF